MAQETLEHMGLGGKWQATPLLFSYPTKNGNDEAWASDLVVLFLNAFFPTPTLVAPKFARENGRLAEVIHRHLAGQHVK